MSLIIILIGGLIFGFICMKMAEKRGREKYLGFLMGFLLGIFAVIGYLIAGDTSEKKAKLIAEAIEKKK